jgi:thioredoxin-related protein
MCRRGVSGAILLCVLVAAAMGQGVDETRTKGGLQWEPDLKTAWRAAREQQRPLLLFLTMDNCAHCQKMKQTTLQDKGVQTDIDSRFVAVTINVKDEPDFVKMLGISTLPTTVVIQPNGDVVESMRGYLTAKQFREKLLSTARQAAAESDSTTRR